jgi:3-isopropylmalate/(R)-2-methylmalate dehydratase small subunit
MEPFTRLRAIAAPLPESHLDTDVIFPARFLLLPDKAGLGRHVFQERRHRPGQAPFVLDQPPFDAAQILVTGANFGTGSSREHAVWALADFGIRCVIAPSFGEIFYSNCFRNGILPIRLEDQDHAAVMARAVAGEEIDVDLATQAIGLRDAPEIGFQIEPGRKDGLLRGLDEIDLILTEDLADIEAFEARQRAAEPWLWLTPEQLSTFDDTREEARNEQ